MKSDLENKIHKKQFIGLGILAGIIGISQLGYFLYDSKRTTTPPTIEFSTDKVDETPFVLSEFNPNHLDKNQWMAIGFSEREINTILKYKNMIGGYFKSKEQFLKCYPIKKRYEELEPYILLPETNEDAIQNNFATHSNKHKSLNINGKFNPDNLSKNDWMKMGFTDRQAESILKYKMLLGGSFISKEKLRACFIINDNQFAQMKPFILLPESIATSPNSKYQFEKNKINLSYFDPNELDIKGWQGLGFTEKQSQAILNYKEKFLRGSFRTPEDLQKNFIIADRFEELKPYLKFNPQNIKPLEKSNTFIKNNSTTPEIKTDFSSISLNDINFKQLIEFGFTEKTASSILGFRKSLGGFVNKNQIFETYGIDRILAEELVSKVGLNSSDVKKYSLVDAPESWLKTHPYFKYYADKILFYRISYPDDKKIWKFIKAKPEQEAKMKLYLK